MNDATTLPAFVPFLAGIQSGRRGQWLILNRHTLASSVPGEDRVCQMTVRKPEFVQNRRIVVFSPLTDGEKQR